MSLYLGTSPIAVNSSSRNIGEIITSTIPLTDAGLHLLDGSLISGSGSYSAFVTYISGLVSSYPDLFETEANWQSSVTTYGVCGKFVYDSVNNTVRLPKRTSEHGDLIKSYSSGSDWYRIYSDGWCEQGGSTGLLGANSYTRNTITFLKEFVDTNYTITSSANKYSTQNGNSQAYPPFIYTKNTATCVFGGYCWTDGFDWVASGFIDVSDLELSPLYEYIVIATSVKTEIEVDIDEIATDLNGKADTDLTNITNTAKVSIAHNAMPSDTYVDLTLGASDSVYTAPADGWFTISKIAGSDWYIVSMQILDTKGTNILLNQTITGYRTTNLQGSLPARKGQKCRI